MIFVNGGGVKDDHTVDKSDNRTVFTFWTKEKERCPR